MSQIDDFLSGKPAAQKQGESQIDAFLGDAPKRSLTRSVGDSAIALGTGVVQGVKMLTDVAGADNAVSRGLGKAADVLSDLESPYRKAQKQDRATKIKAAEASGSTWEEVKAHAGAFADAPIDTTLNALGTSVPTLATAAIPGLGQAALATRAAQFGVGVAQGVGNIKGQIHETVKQKLMGEGVSESEASQRADAAQAYGGGNMGSIALGGALGGLAGGTGAESAARRLLGRQLAGEVAERAAPGLVRSAVGGVLKEAPMEAVQGGQERLAGNLALQGEGFDVPTWQGVAGQAALEGLASAPVGGGFGVADGMHARAEAQARQQAEANAQQAQDEQRAAATQIAQDAAMTRAGTLADEEVSTPVADDGGAGLREQQAVAQRLRDQEMQASRSMASPDDEIFQSTGADVGVAAPAPAATVAQDSRPPSQQMGIDPAAGPLSKLAASAVDSGIAQEAQFLGATGRDLQVRRTGPGVADESNVIDVQGRVVEDRAIGTPRRIEAARRLGGAEVESFSTGANQHQFSANAPANAGAANSAPALSLQAQAAMNSVADHPPNLSNGVPNGHQATQAQQTTQEPAQAGAAPRSTVERAALEGGSGAAGEVVQGAVGVGRAATSQNIGAQGQEAARAQGTAQAAAEPVAGRPDDWRKSMLKAGPVAKAMGIDTKGKRLAQVVAEIDARDTQTPTTPAPQPAPGPVRLGRDNRPLSEGGKPFKTRNAAGDAKKLQPMMRVVSVEGGYALAEKTPAQLAAQAKAARRLAQPRTGASGEPIAAHAFIAAAGGLHPNTRADLNVGDNPRIGNRRLFAGPGRGMTIERATERLIAEGYLSEGASHNDAYALIKTSLTRPQYNADGIERIAQAESDARFEDYLAAQEEAAADGDADPFGMAEAFTEEELAEVGYTLADPALQAEVNALIAQSDAIGIDTYAILDDIARTYADATQDEFNATARDAIAAAIARGNQDGGGTAAQAAPAAEPAQEPGLTAPTRADIEAQQEARDKAEREEATRQRVAAQAASQDENRKRIAQASVRAAAEFELGQDPLDSLTGQGSMFDDAPTQQEPAAEVGATLPAEVKRALQADVEGRIADDGRDDRNAFTLQRLNRDTGQMEPVTFERGEYVRYTVGGKDQFGEIDGISQARREFGVGGLWYPFGFAYKAERPAAPERKDAAPLSEVIDKMNAKHGAGLTDADRVPEQKPASKTPTVDRHNAAMAAVREGIATPDQFKASFEAVVSNKDAIKAELSTKTKAELLKDGGAYFRMRYANENKADVVDAVYSDMLGEYALGESVTYGMARDSYQKAVRRLVEATDADKLARYVADRKAAAEEYAAQRAAKAAALQSPQTLTDYRSLIQSHINEGKTRKEAFLMLTPEQRIQYDKLEAESTKEARESRKRAAKTEVRTAGQTTGGEIIATKHTRDGYDLFVVKLADRLSADDYKTVLASAKKLGGWYSAFRGNGAIPGFQFKDKTNAEAFLALAGGDTTAAQKQVAQRRDAFEDDRSQGAAERLNEMAGKLEESADEEINRDRKANTARRARFASAALGAARAQQAMAKTMRNIAKAIEDGTAKFLDAVRTKNQVEMLTGFVRTAKDAELRAKYDSYADQEKRKGEPPTAATADFAEFPAFTAFRSDLATLARQMLEVDGTKKLGQQLMKVADDVTDAYLEFAKGNLHKVSTFAFKDGSGANFASKDAGEAAIRRSGLVGRAMLLQIKRGENVVIMSPSEAMNRGIWQGDGDKRITLTGEFAGELVQAIGRRGSKQNGLAVPWQFQTAYDRRKALARIGIETPSEFRSALREFVALQETAVADKVRDMELSMVGRKADGLDFFPTPAEVADQMVEAADIQPDMAVLEPSAGMGHLADRIREAGAEPDVIEIASDRRALLEEKGYTTQDVDDFLDLKPREFFTFGDTFRAPDGAEGIMRGASGNRVRLVNDAGDMVGAGYYDRAELTGVAHNGTASGYDRIVMNPPFSNRRDAEHVRHAYSLLKPGGRIVAIMGEGVFFGNDKKAQEFREWLESVGGTSEKLPDGSFLDPSLPVTTGANARMVVIDKAEGVAMFSRSPATKTAYEARIDALFSGEKPRLQGARVLDRSDMLAFLGFGDGPVNLSEGKVVVGKDNHPHMTAAVWKKIPEWLENPALVFDSDTTQGRLVFIAPEMVNGSPVRIIVEPNAAGGVKAHLLVNAYDAKGGSFRRWESEGLLRYVDRNKYAHVSGSFQPQLAGLPGDRGRRNIVTDKQYNGWRRANTTAYSQEMSPELANTLLAIRRPATKESVRAAVRELVNGLGILPNRLGRVVVATAAEIQQEWEPLIGPVQLHAEQGGDGAAQGFYDPNTRTVFLIADHIRQGDELGVVAHELMHKHGQAVLGEEGWNRLHGAIEGWASAPEGSQERRVYDEAAARVRQSRPTDAAGQEYSSQELFPYAVQVALEQGVRPNLLAKPGTVARWLGQVKAALRDVWRKIVGKPESFNAQDLVNLAFGIAQRENPEHARELDGAVQGGARGNVLQELAATDALFRVPKSSATTVEGIAEDIGKDINVRKVQGIPGRQEYEITMPSGDKATLSVRSPNPYGESVYGFDLEDGEMANMELERPGDNPQDVPRDVEDVWIDASRLSGQGDGMLLYALAANYAYNTGRIFIGDPAGLSDQALRRRSEQMLSSALKFGTTAHLAPHPRQVRGDSRLGVPPLKWVYGDDLGNIRRLVDLNLKAMENAGESSITYDPEHGTYLDSNGTPIDRDGISILADSGYGRNAGAGSTTLARRAVLDSLLRATSEKGRGEDGRPDALLEVLLGQSHRHPAATERLFYSRTVAAPERIGDALKSITVTDLKNQAAFKAADLRPLGLQFLGRRQLVDVYGDMLPELRRYSDLMARMDADKNEAGAGADKLAQDWAKLPDERQLAELMHDSTLAQIDPTKDFVEGDNKTDWTRLRARHQALSPAAKEVFARARDTYRKHMHDVRSAIKERIERAEMSSERRAALLKRMDDEFFGHIKGVYFPLARFGQYVVVVKGADGKVENVSRAETMAEADATRRQLLSAFPPGKGFTVGKVLKAKDFVAERDTVGRGFMEQLYGVLDKQGMDAKQRAELEDALGQLYLSSLPDLSWAKHGIHRKGTAGFSQDARRAFAQNVFHGASYLAKLRYGDRLQDELGEMQRRVDAGSTDSSFDSVKAQQVVDEMVKRHDAAMNPKTNALSTALTSFGFMFHLGLSPASAMVNLTQTALVAYPVMGARWGFAKAGAALLQASQEAARGKNDITASLTADEKAAFDEAVRSGVIDVTMAHDLAGIAQGEDRNVSHKLQPVMKAASFLFHHAEKFNRQVTFVAAYRLAREAGADAKAAYAQAAQATYDGHFDYSANNRPRVMQGNVARVLLLFKQYGQNMVYTLTRSAQQSLKGATPEARAQARKALGGLLAMHAMAAGVLGLPMVTTLLAAASMMGGDDDEPWDAKVALQNLLADTFGQKPAEVLAHGLSRLTPWDISGRVGLDKLIFPDVQEGLEGQRLAESAMTAALGPVAGIGINVLKGLQEMSDGRYLRGLETMAPSVARGPLKALRYGGEGVKDKSGIVVQDEVDAAALWGQAAGFSPSSVRNAYEGKSAIVSHDRALQARRSSLVEQFAMAAMAKDEEGKAEAREAIAKFNEKNPNRRIQPMHLAQSVAMRQKRIREAQDGVYLPTKRRDAADVGRFAFAGAE